MGISNVQVKANMIMGVNINAGITEDQAEANMDIGIVNVQVAAFGAKVELDGILIEKIIIQERILEINGEEVSQTDITQQIFEIKEGEVIRHSPEKAEIPHSGK